MNSVFLSFDLGYFAKDIPRYGRQLQDYKESLRTGTTSVGMTSIELAYKADPAPRLIETYHWQPQEPVSAAN